MGLRGEAEAGVNMGVRRVSLSMFPFVFSIIINFLFKIFR